MAATRDRHADLRRRRYATGGLEPDVKLPRLTTELRCEACTRGHGVVIGRMRTGRVMLECDFCGRRAYPQPAAWRP